MTERRVPYLNDDPTNDDMWYAGLALTLFALSGLPPECVYKIAKLCSQRIRQTGCVIITWENGKPVVTTEPQEEK